MPNSFSKTNQTIRNFHTTKCSQSVPFSIAQLSFNSCSRSSFTFQLQIEVQRTVGIRLVQVRYHTQVPEYVPAGTV